MTQSNPFAQPAANTNPFGQPAAAPAAPAWMTQTAPAAPAGPPFTPPPAAAGANTYIPPALNVGALGTVAPPAAGGADGADLWAMFGWLVLILPTHIETVAKPAQYITEKDRQNGTLTRERITANVVVIGDPNGGTADLQWGGDPRALPVGSKPHTHTDPLPYVRKGMWLSGKLVGQLRGGLPPAPGQAPSPLVGRVMKDGPDKTDPWFIITATDEDLARARYYLEAVGRGQFPHPLAP